MRSFSLFTILILSLTILVIDILAFYWLQSITQLIAFKSVKLAINILFWFFTIGLISAIIILKVRLDDLHPKYRYRLISRFYGLAVSSFVPKLIFVIVISIFYFANFIFSETESLVVIPIVGLLSGFLPFFIIVFGALKSRYRFKVHHVKLKLERLPKAFVGYRIVQISDLHLGSFSYRYETLEKAIDLINDLEADIICFTGDLVNNFAWELRGWENVFGKLKAEKGKYAVLGNHDYGDYSKWASPQEKEENFYSIKQFLKDIGFRLLRNESEILQNEDDKIALLGVEYWENKVHKNKCKLPEAMKVAQQVSLKILLSHNPAHWNAEVVGNEEIALTLSGHTHGMQAGFQYKNFQWSPIKYRFKHWAGLYQIGSQYLYVNRGLGWLGFPARIGMRPEITFIELEANDI